MDDTFPTRRQAGLRHCRGFTLVEMLVVIAIIAVLAGLITVAGAAAVKKAKQTTIKNDLTQLEMAVSAYKEKYGDYPPDFADMRLRETRRLVLAHLRKAFPRYILSGNIPQQWQTFHEDVQTACGLNVDDLTPANALVFWLGGLPDADGRLTGFSADPANPFQAGGSRTDPLFEFDQTRLFVVNGWPAYKNEHVRGDVPCVYFRVRTCPEKGVLEYKAAADRGNDHNILWFDAKNAGICVPYCVQVVQDEVTWNKPKSFQIISPGLDGRFGSAPAETGMERLSPTGVNFTDGDYDNITNFSNTTLEDGLE